MLRILCVAVVMMCVSVTVLRAQVPQRFLYQAVVHLSDGRLAVNSHVGIRVQILQGSSQGASVYTTTTTAETNDQGLFTIDLGGNTQFESIDWHEGPYFLKVEVDPAGGSSYGTPRVEQIVSVPYALHSYVADSLRGRDLKEHQVLSIGHDTIYLTGGSYVVLPPDFDGRYASLRGRPANVSVFTNDAGYITQEVQVLTKSHDTLFLTGGSFAKLPAGFDGDYNSLTNKPVIPTATSQLTNNSGFLTAESQVLWVGSDTVFLTGGSSVKIPHQVEVQDFTDVVALGNSAYSQLKQVLDPTDPQDAVNKYYFDSILENWTAGKRYHGSHNVFDIKSCGPYTWYGTTYTSPGVYVFSYLNAQNVACVDTLKLTMFPSNNMAYSRAAHGSYQWHDSVYTSTGTYLYNYLDRNGCPCVDTLRLTMYPAAADCISIRNETDTAISVVCGGLNWYGSVIRENGVYQHDLGHISYQGCDSIVKIRVSIKPVFQQDTMARFSTSFAWRGHTYTQQGDYGDTMIAANGCDSIYMLHLMEGGQEGIGAAQGLFSVSNGVQVRFAQGNLQYQSSTNYWQFAKHQYDVIGLTCETSYYTSWADLFGWATSGYHDSTDMHNTMYHPWDTYHVSVLKTSPVYALNQYGYGPSTDRASTNLNGLSRYYDWGIYNPVVNGGNGAGLWRLLSNDEWDYLLNQRNNAAYLHSLARIYDVPTDQGTTVVYGYILLCDNWVRPASITFTPNAANCDVNSYSISEWRVLESSGAVFLPMWYDNYRYIGNYWTSTSGGAGSAFALTMTDQSFVKAPYNRSDSYSVRLVQEHSAGVVDCRCTYLDTNVIAPGPFSWHGYSYSKSGDYIETIVNHAGCDSIITLHLMISSEGPLNGVFSVSDTHQVYFSKGNLQHNPAQNLWRFSNHQFDYIGKENKNARATYDGWLDLFGWATSGYHDRTDVLNRYYYPYETIQNSDGYGPSVNKADWDMIATSAQYDWGMRHPIANGGNTPGQWRTLTKDEWYYLINTRTNAVNLQGRATVNGVRGLVILPDNWTPITGIVFTPDADDFDTNVYTVTRWSMMESAGAVFLPAAGWRDGTNLQHTNFSGLYWSSTIRKEGVNQDWTNSVWYLVFGDPPIGINYKAIVREDTWDGYYTFGIKQFGYSVRLVKDL